jgi:single-strand DNA-binding protein
MNNLIISGNVGSVKETSFENGSKTVLNFNVAVNSYYTNKQGEKVTKTTWFDCSLWNRPNVYQYIKKGTHVIIKGAAEARAYLNSNNEPTAVVAVNVDEIEFFNKDKGEATEAPEEPAN